MEVENTTQVDLVLSVIYSIDNITVGEWTELFNTQYPELAMPRGEMSKRVSYLKNTGKIAPVDNRVCSVAGTKQIEWSYKVSTPASAGLLEKAKRDLNTAQDAYTKALNFYRLLTHA